TNVIKWPWRLRAAMKYQARRQAKKNSPQVWWGRQFIRIAKFLTACWLLIATADVIWSSTRRQHDWNIEKFMLSMSVYLIAGIVCWADRALREMGFRMIAVGTAPSYSLTMGRHVAQDPTNLVIRTFDHSGRQFAFVVKEDCCVFLLLQEQYCCCLR